MINITRNVSLSLSADDWSLYDLPGRDSAAEGLNTLIAGAINEAPDKGSAIAACGPHLDFFRDYGAADSEGWSMVEHIVDKVWPRRFV